MENQDYVKVGNASFNVESVKAMKREDFITAHPDLDEPGKIYDQIVSQKAETPVAETVSNEAEKKAPKK